MIQPRIKILAIGTTVTNRVIKSCVFVIFDVLSDEAGATPEEVRSRPKAASNKQNQQQKKQE